MKKLKKQCCVLMLVCALFGACLLNGCAKKDNDIGQNDGAGAEQGVAEVDMEEEWKEMPNQEIDLEEWKGKPESAEEFNVRPLSDEEIAEFTKFVTEADGYGNYGFLLSVYDSPEKINLEEVFYTGAGIKTEALSEEEEKAYLKAAGYEEIYTDVTKLTTAQINEVLLRRTGLSYEQMANPLSWTYLPEYDAYYHEAGDTNYTPYTCIGGTVENEKRFRLQFRRDEMREGAYREIDTVTVLEKTEEGYRFISNRLMTEVGLIKDQTFQTNVADFGEVTIAAYEPDTEKDPYADVTFVMLKDGQIITYLSGMGEDNIRYATFNKVECVSFPDYNCDGYTDMIAICSYFPYGEAEYKEARIYTGNEWGYFYLEKELSEEANSAVAELSIESVLVFLGYDR